MMYDVGEATTLLLLALSSLFSSSFLQSRPRSWPHRPLKFVPRRSFFRPPSEQYVDNIIPPSYYQCVVIVLVFSLL
ncbi:hypothetical protein B0H13DRAFT_270775 [Mycena leptocephala]|nr:hypothetical protein B0H13DRAFT_270775 [Mycena leptocephala]